MLLDCPGGGDEPGLRSPSPHCRRRTGCLGSFSNQSVVHHFSTSQSQLSRTGALGPADRRTPRSCGTGPSPFRQTRIGGPLPERLYHPRHVAPLTAAATDRPYWLERLRRSVDVHSPKKQPKAALHRIGSSRFGQLLERESSSVCQREKRGAAAALNTPFNTDSVRLARIWG